MAERQTINEVVQVGVETVTGTAVAATRRLGITNVDVTPRLETAQFKAAGYRWNGVSVLNKEWSEFSLPTTAGVYDELVIPLSGLFGAATISTPGGGTLTREWLWNPSTTAPLTPKTYTFEKGSFVRASRFTGAQFASFTMAFSRDEVTSGGGGFAQAMVNGVQLTKNATYTLTAAASPPTAGTYTLTHSGNTTTAIAFGATPAAVQTALEALASIGTGNVVVSLTTLGPTTATANTVYTIEFRGTLAGQAVTLTGTFTTLTPSGSIAIAAGVVGSTPTQASIIPIQPNDVDVYLDTAAAGLGVTKLLRVHNVNFNLSDLYSPYWVVNSANASYVATVETEPGGTVTLVQQADAAGEQGLTDARNGTRMFMRIEGIGPLIEGALFYRFRADFALEVTGFAYGTDQGVRTAETTYSIMHDATWGKALSMNLRNTLTVLS